VKKLTEKFIQFFPYFIAIAFSIKATREPDIWWQIRTGEWILESGQVPKTDMFSNSVAGTEWINIKWGFEVLAAWITKLCGPECVFLLQILATIGIVYCLKKLFKLFEINNLISNALVLFITLSFIEYRVIGRPEMTTHLLFVVYLYILFNHFKNPSSKLIWLIIPLQMFWTNMHEAYGLGIVLIGIFFFAAWVDVVKSKTEKPKVVSFVLGLSILAILVNPRGVVMLLRPLNIFSQVNNNKFTTELANVLDPDFWQKESYIFIITLLLIVWVVFKKRDFLIQKLNTFKLQFVSLLLLVAFVFLSLTAARNIIFYFLLVSPLLAIMVQEYLPRKLLNAKVILIVGILFYVSIVSGAYYKVTNSKNEYGLFVHPGFNPIGASNYIKTHDLRNKKCFSSYMVSSYLLWDIQPDFKTYIDLRDLDVFTSDFFESYFTNAQVPEKFQRLDQKEQFEYVVLYRNFSPQLHHYLYTDTIYGCVYADPICAIYQKTDDLAQGDHFAPLQEVETSIIASLISSIFNPLYQQKDYTQIDVNLAAAEFYKSAGVLSLARKRVNLYLSAYPNDASAFELRKSLNTFTQ
jgi:hypothetical protein